MAEEVAVFEVQQGQGENFVEAYNGVALVLNGAPGSRSATPRRGIEDPSFSTLLVEWNSVDVHTALAQEPGFEEFGDAIGLRLAGRPEFRYGEAVG